MKTLATIGYEGASLADVIGRLQRADIKTLIDVRAIAASRRPGFSKGVLSASLAEAGVDYRHLRPLGTPKAGGEAAHAGRTGEMRRIYEAHLETTEAADALAEAGAIALEKPSALLCYEADAARCHRRILAERLAEGGRFRIVDL